MGGWLADARRECLGCNARLSAVEVTIRNTGDSWMGPFVLLSTPSCRRTIVDHVEGSSEARVRLYEAGFRIVQVMVSRIGEGCLDRQVLHVS